MTEEQFKQLNTELILQRMYLQAIANHLNISKDSLINLVDDYKQNAIKQTESTTEYPSVDDAPEWKLVFKVNTSEGVSTQKIIQRAWTEKQAIFLGRTEQLFPTMNELVKAKQIQAKWNVLESNAEKISA
jgi:hypothetical protein